MVSLASCPSISCCPAPVPAGVKLWTTLVRALGRSIRELVLLLVVVVLLLVVGVLVVAWLTVQDFT